jgi:broad specificity phosphatase PhoE
MSEETSDTTDLDVSDFQPITSQDALDKVIGQRIDRVKKQYAGFDELKAKAEKFDEFQESAKSDLQRAQERAAQLERELNSERQMRVRESIAAQKGVPATALTGSTQEELEASADALLEWRQTQQREKPGKPARGLKSGVTGSDQGLDPKEAAAVALRSLRQH